MNSVEMNNHEQRTEHTENITHTQHIQESAIKRNYLPILFLIMLVVLAFWLRSYHADFPVIGYHDWKETHYLTEAREFARDGFFKNGFFVPVTDYPTSVPGIGVHPDSFPTISVLVALAFDIFGIKLLVARLVTILFSIATIPLAYLVAKQLFKREDIALTSATLFAFNPLLVFFGRNVQLDAPALFFMLVGWYYYAKWYDYQDNDKFLIASVFFTMFSMLTKYTFVLAAAPMLWTFPWKKLFKWQVRWKTIFICIVIIAIIPAWVLYTTTIPGKYGVKEAISGDTVKLGTILLPEFWSTMSLYVNDNFPIFQSVPLFGWFLAIIGIVLAFVHYKKSLGTKFLASLGVGSLLWFFILAYKLSGHSYHQYPIVPIILFSWAYIFIVLAVTVESFTTKHARWIVLAILVLILVPASIAGWQRQFNTLFPGVEVAGDYINSHGNQEDKILHSGHQSFGIHWSADRKGGAIPGQLNGTNGLKDIVEKQNIQWVLIYNWRFEIFQEQPIPERANYLRQNFHVAQVGFAQNGQNSQLLYLLLKRGGTFNESSFPQLFANKRQTPHDYEMLGGGTQRIVTMDIE